MMLILWVYECFVNPAVENKPWKQGFELFTLAYLPLSLNPYIEKEIHKYLLHGLTDLGDMKRESGEVKKKA